MFLGAHVIDSSTVTQHRLPSAQIESVENSLENRLKQLRTERHGPRGLSAFARELRVSKNTYYKWEHGSKPPFSIIKQIATLTDCNLVWLFTGFGDAADPPNRYASEAVAETLAEFGEEAPVERIKDGTLAKLLLQLAARNEEIMNLQRQMHAETRRFHETIAELRQDIARLEAKLK